MRLTESALTVLDSLVKVIHIKGGLPNDMDAFGRGLLMEFKN